MKRVVFINLLIDRFWAKGSFLEKLFSLSNPESLRLSLISYNLGLYFRDEITKDQDIYLGSLKLDDYWLSHFKKFHQIDPSQIVNIPVDPFKISEWLEEYKRLSILNSVSDFVFSSYSELEASLEVLHGKEKSKEKISRNRFLNDKTTLVEWIKKQDIAFPKTDMVLGEDILFDHHEDSFVYKFHLSSGGGGKFSQAQLKSFQPWVHSRGLEKEWKKSLWLRQEKLVIKKEFSIFSHTNRNDFEIALVEYDSSSLSYLHFFGLKLSAAEEKAFQEVFVKIKTFLRENSYEGYFGFDALKSQEELFPLVDLNVRMTKTHLLWMGMKTWNPSYAIKAFYRKRFKNLKEKGSFKSFWEEFCNHLSLTSFGEASGQQIFPFEISGFSEGKSEVTFLLSQDTEEKVRLLVGKIDRVMKKMGYE